MTDGGAPLASLRDVPDGRIERLKSTKIFFGHQSVGGNIMEGFEDVRSRDPRVELRIVSSTEADARPAFAHAKIGKNGDPGGKTDAFAAIIDRQPAGAVDIAFHKYCYADFDRTTDVPRAFDHYKQVMDRLRSAHPDITFVHVTVPLVQVQGGLKGMVKQWLGRERDHYADNVARERFNDLMRRQYAASELFDLARIESTRPDGSRETVEFANTSTYSLVPAYNSDGSHLSSTGQRVVAAQLIAFLADVADRSASRTNR